MENEGCVLSFHYREIALMGFLEVFLHFRRVLRYLRMVKKDLLDFKPDGLILVDFGGFNLKMAHFAKKNQIPVHYYIAPKVWAWNQNRALKLKENVARLYTILPFEQDFYKKFNWKVDYVGNPLLDEINKFKPNPDFLNSHGLGKWPIVALLPGSRVQEIQKMLATMVDLKSEFRQVDFVVAGVENLPSKIYENARSEGMKLVFNSTYDLLFHAKAAIVTSGTATLETAIFKVPQIVVYKTSTISYHIARHLIRVPFISLVNLVAEKEVVKELIQAAYNHRAVMEELGRLLGEEERRNTILKGYDQVILKIGQKKASQETAGLIYQSLIS